MQAATVDLYTGQVLQVVTADTTADLAPVLDSQQWLTDMQWTVTPTVGQIWNKVVPASFSAPPPVQSMTPLQFITALGSAAPALWAAAGSNPAITQWWVQGMTSGDIERSIALPAMQELEAAGVIPPGTSAQVWGA